ncbi:MAG: N-acetyltransferase [Alphaproteobacteria bacterium]
MDSLSPDALQIEKMKSYDLPAIASLHAICFEDSWHTELLGRILSAPGTFGLFSRPRGKVVGFVLCRSRGQEGEILSLAVSPGVRRKGLGGALLDAAKAQAVKHDLEALFLEVAEDNLAARRLYEKFGFATVGRRPHYYLRRYGPSVDALTLRCKLSSNMSLEK